MIFLVKSFLGNFKDIWQFFSDHTGHNQRLSNPFHETRNRFKQIGGSPGLVVMGGDSCSKCREFESHHRILDRHFSHAYLLCVWKGENKLKRGRGWPIFKKNVSSEFYFDLTSFDLKTESHKNIFAKSFLTSLHVKWVSGRQFGPNSWFMFVPSSH